ncbi:MAG TPA: SBBP repeat-containing protein [Flavipsychrobacter sp.]|nr:SBBP repeat-containing protein [Flavipsychrobacter sp.]
MKLISVFGARLLLVFVLTSSFISSSGQGFARAQQITSLVYTGNRAVTGCVTDGNNNSYFVGAFSGTTDLDPGVAVMDVTAVGQYDMFILKEDAAGNLIWVKQIAAVTPNIGSCGGKIGLDSAGNVYIGGVFKYDFDFDPGPGIQQLSSNGGYHSFVLKLDPAGNFLWVRDMGNQTDTASMQMLCMKMDAAANIFFACSIVGSVTANTIDVDPGPGIYTIICPTTGLGSDILLEKLDSAGNFVWAKQISGTNDKDAYGLAVDSLSNVYITGQLSGTADFDPGPGTSNLTSTAGCDAFIAKYDSAGSYLWAGQISGGGDEVGQGIAADTFGNIMVTGHYAAGTADFDPGPGVYNITATSMDMFVLKLRSDGSFAWARSAHPSGNDRGLRIATDGQGNVYTTGDFFSTADFDPGPGEYMLSGVGYIQKLDSAGDFIWARAYGGQYPSDIALDNANDIYVVGQFSSSGDFDPGPGVFNLTGGPAGFIEKLCGSSLAISADDSTLCVGDQAQLTTPAITGATYTWTMDGSVIAGSSNTITVSTPGVYEVYVTGGCPNASGPLYVYDCLGVGETMKADGIAVYPNPAHDQLTINTTLTNYTITILNTLGQLTEKIAGNWSAVLDVSQYTPGVYYLRIETTDGQMLNRKFVVGQ